MTSAEENMFLEAQKAIEAGEKARGKDLLTRLLKDDQQNPEYWLWMSAAVESEKERKYCLNQALKFDPDNQMARRGLILLGELPVDPSLVIPYVQQKRNWQLPEITTTQRPLPKIQWWKVGLTFLALAAVISVIVIALRSDRLWLFRGRNIAAIGTAIPTPTYPASPTPTITHTPRIQEPTAPWEILQNTYTPTPIYVFTPHPIVEAFSIAMRNFQKQDWEQTINFLNQAIQTESKSPDLYYLLGEAYLQSHDIENALSSFEKGIEIDPSFAACYLGRAKVKIINIADTSEIIDDLYKSIELDQDYFDGHLTLIDTLLKEGQLEEARSLLGEVERINPNSPLIDVVKGKVALKDGEIKIAMSYVESALEKDLTLLSAYKLMGEIHQANGEPGKSLEPLLIYYKYNTSHDAEIEILLSTAYATNNMFEEAIALLDGILERDPQFVAGFIQRGTIYTQMEEYEKALADYKSATKLEPKSFDLCILLSDAYFSIEKPGNAYQQASECQKLAETDQELAHMFFNRAIALEALNNDVAKLDWERMLELNPESIKPEWQATATAFLATHYPPTRTMSPTLTSSKTVTPKTTITLTSTPEVTFTITPTGD